MVIGSIASTAATLTGLVAAAIAVTGFLAHAVPALSGKSDDSLRRATVFGGLAGIAWSTVVILLSALIG